MTIFNLDYFQANFLNGFQEQEQHISCMDLAIKNTAYSFFIEFSFSGLSGDLSIFFETLKTMSDNNKADVPSDDFQIQTFDAAQQDELISVADSAADASMAYIQQEYSDLSSKYQMVLKMLEEEQKQRARNQQEHENRERLLEEQLETLRQQFNEFTTASNSTADADGKLEKLKVRFTYPLFLLR